MGFDSGFKGLMHGYEFYEDIPNLFLLELRILRLSLTPSVFLVVA